MDARDICRRLGCSPMLLSEWVEKGCPLWYRQPPHVRFETEKVKEWLKQNNITDWPKENDYDLDWPIRSILKALQRKEITPWDAEKIILNLGSGIWG